jgi:hypothetical protein
MYVQSTPELLASSGSGANLDQISTSWVLTVALAALALIFLKVWIDERFDIWEQAQEDRAWHRLNSTVERARRDFR